jgi:hypothetical protein
MIEVRPLSPGTLTQKTKLIRSLLLSARGKRLTFTWILGIPFSSFMLMGPPGESTGYLLLVIKTMNTW